MRQKRNRASCLIIFLLCIAASFLTGCLIDEETEYSLTLNADGKSGTFNVVQRHIESDAQDAGTQQKDFNELIANWKSDRYLLDQMDKGLYVKSRSLRKEKGVLVWKETSLFSDIEKLIPQYSPDDTLRFPLHNTKGLEIHTNGKLVAMQDSAVILWKPHTMHFELRTRTLGFTSSSRFADRFSAAMKKR